MVKKIVASLLIVSLMVVGWPHEARATHTITDLGTITVTSTGTGLVKLTTAVERVRLGAQLMHFAGRWVGPVSIAFAVADVALNVWDWYRHTFNAGTTPAAVSGGSWSWGVAGTQSIFAYTVYTDAFYTQCGGGSVPRLVWNVDPAGINWSKVVGGKTVDWNCGFPSVRGGELVYLYIQAANATTTVAYTGANDLSREQAITDLVSYRDALLAGDPIPNNVVDLVTGAGYPNTVGDPRARAVQTLNDAIDVIDRGVGLQPGDGLTTTGPGQGGSAPAPVGNTGTGTGTGTGTLSPLATGGTDLTATNQKLDTMINTPAQQAPTFACPVCTRTTEWSTLMGSLQSAASGAPIFGLIARLSWPGSGTVQRQWTLGSWRGGTLSVDLSYSGIDTAITVVRFVVIGSAIIAAYMIIFG